MNISYAKLLSFKRNSLEEKVHFGYIVHINKNKIINQVGECEDIKFYQRSCSKPMQFSALINEKTDDKFSFTPQEIAVCCASHTGTKEHQKHILSVLNKIGLSEDSLLCPPDSPLSKDEQEFLIKNNLPVRKIHNNCSGKHAAMLALCKDKDFDISTYNSLSNPLSKLVIEQLSSLCEVSQNNIIISKDGCTLPTVATTLPELCRGFLNLFLSNKYKKITKAILEFPYFAGGEGRIDSEIINSGQGNLISKVGAEGIIVVVNLNKEEALAVKIADSNYLARSLVIVKSMLNLGWLTREQVSLSPLNDLYKTNIQTETGEVVGAVEFCSELSNK